MTTPGGEQRLGRLRWRCRRGMKELDVLLEGFVAAETAALADGAWPEFEDLLDTEDDQLWDWLQGRGAPPPDWARLVEALRRRA